MPKFALSTPMFIKVTGVDEYYLPIVNGFLARDDIKSHREVFAGDKNLGRLPFIELVSSKLDTEYGTYTLDFKVHPYFRSWKTSPEEFTKRFCSMRVMEDFFYTNFNYFENPT